MTAVISVERAHRVMRLLDEFREIGPGSEAARAHLATSLCALVGAEVGALVLDTDHRPAGRRGLRGLTPLHFTREVTACSDLLEAQGCSAHPIHHALMVAHLAEPATIRCATDTMIPRDAWLSSPFVADGLRPAGVDRYLTSIRYVAKNVIDAIAFYRAAGSRPFMEEDRHALELVHAWLPHLFPPKRVALPPRVEEAVGVLATGASDKEIAAALGVSYHTAREYVRTALVAYGVASRAQLIAKLASR